MVTYTMPFLRKTPKDFPIGCQIELSNLYKDMPSYKGVVVGHDYFKHGGVDTLVLITKGESGKIKRILTVFNPNIKLRKSKPTGDGTRLESERG